MAVPGPLEEIIVTDPELDDTTVVRTPALDEQPRPAAETASAAAGEPAATDRTAPAQYGVGPFSIREVALGGIWLVAFIVSFFPLVLVDLTVREGGANVWVSGLSWILSIGAPTVAVFLLALRRLSPQGIRRFGSLGVDQFASVAFSVAAIVWLTWLWETVAIAIQYEVWTRSWVLWVETVLMIAAVVLTVLAPVIPVFEQDFQDRPEVPAHRNARPVRAVVARPRRERPVPAPAPAPATAPAPAGHEAPPAYTAPATAPAPAETEERDLSATDVFAPLRETGPQEPVAAAEPRTETATQAWEPAADETVASARPAQQAFWALVPVERDVVDEYGAPLFRIGPTAWALVIEDRGEVFVVRHDDGRIGYLHDVSGVTRG
ncbi:hypothetical protein ACIQLJ_07735 [Microbacterium sp. NPDC091313]